MVQSPAALEVSRINDDGETRSERHRALWIMLVILLAGVAAYSNSFRGAFVFDDPGSITQNQTLRGLWESLSPPKGAETVSGRPILNVSLAINYALHGLNASGYHVLNLTIHVAAGLALFGIVRRTLLLESMRDRFAGAATWIAGAAALIWTVHPLQTESVTYIVQRAESLSGMFYLLVLYCFLRGVAAKRGLRWLGAAVIASLLGIGTKETLVSAPLIILLYDRAFVAGFFSDALRRRWKFYTALAVITWGALGCLMWTNAHRGGTAGLGLAINSMDYARTQVGAIATYLKLSVWPAPLVLDYGVPVVRSWSDVAPQAGLVGALVAMAIWAVWKAPKVGFAAAAFFACLAPTSSIVPVTTQTIAEHRMYLALAAELTLMVVGVWVGWEKIRPRMSPWRLAPAAAACLFAVLFGATTFDRNLDYQTALSIWLDTIAKRPNNARAYNGAGQALKEQRRFDQALIFYTRSIELEPTVAKWHNNRGNVYYAMQEYPKAIGDYDRALELDPKLKGAYANRSVSWFFMRDYQKAWADVQRAVALGAKPHPDFVTALTRASGRAYEPVANTPIENE